ncbi:hypothetical protein ACFWGI_36740 [Streptomyces niveus]|uniref:hypothetical protein n=1 Tax=Streptomyces niveus TaxID=193462 RepID=UPI00365E8C2D
MTDRTKIPPGATTGTVADTDRAEPEVFRQGRTYDRPPFTMVPEWITFSGLSMQAKALYQILAAHVNQERKLALGDTQVWPSEAMMALAAGYAQERSVRRYVRELEALGAINVERTRNPFNHMRKMNIYTVHEAPPPGYDGPADLDDFYQRNRPDDETKQ